MKINGVHGESPEKGGSFVEFAVVFPVAMCMLFGLIDLSMFFYYQASMTNVVRSTLRYTVTGRYETNPAGAGTNADYINRKQSAINEATRSLMPLLSLTAPKGDIRFLDPTTGAALDNDLGGPGARVKVVMRQKVDFLTPFARMIGATNGGLSTNAYNLEVSTVYRSEGYTPKTDVTP